MGDIVARVGGVGVVNWAAGVGVSVPALLFSLAPCDGLNAVFPLSAASLIVCRIAPPVGTAQNSLFDSKKQWKVDFLFLEDVQETRIRIIIKNKIDDGEKRTNGTNKELGWEGRPGQVGVVGVDVLVEGPWSTAVLWALALTLGVVSGSDTLLTGDAGCRCGYVRWRRQLREGEIERQRESEILSVSYQIKSILGYFCLRLTLLFSAMPAQLTHPTIRGRPRVFVSYFCSKPSKFMRAIQSSSTVVVNTVDNPYSKCRIFICFESGQVNHCPR